MAGVGRLTEVDAEDEYGFDAEVAAVALAIEAAEAGAAASPSSSFPSSLRGRFRGGFDIESVEYQRVRLRGVRVSVDGDEVACLI